MCVRPKFVNSSTKIELKVIGLVAIFWLFFFITFFEKKLCFYFSIRGFHNNNWRRFFSSRNATSLLLDCLHSYMRTSSDSHRQYMSIGLRVRVYTKPVAWVSSIRCNLIHSYTCRCSYARSYARTHTHTHKHIHISCDVLSTLTHTMTPLVGQNRWQ